MDDELVAAVADLREEDALKIIKDRMDAGVDTKDILVACREGMTLVGKRFDESEYFLPELILSGEIFKRIMGVVLTAGERTGVESQGKVLIGTVEGDIHDIGKNIVSFMLQANGFDVHDIGIDKPPQEFVDKIKEIQPSIVGMSGLISVSHSAMKRTVEAIEAAGLRDSLHIMIGGGKMSDEVLSFVGADAFGRDAFEAVELCKKWSP